jgi:phosphatidylserine decarboxylase
MVEVLKRSFVKAMGIDMAEAGARIGTYPSLEALFVRSLRPGLRRVEPDPTCVVSPVDGKVGMCGTVESGTVLQLKGRPYGLARLLGDAEAAARFEGGPFATLYLAPHNYHRVHAPFSGEIREAILIPGALLPVFPSSVDRFDELFARNERLITFIDSPDAGRIALVKVGAMLVGRVSVTYDPDVHTNCRRQQRRVLRYSPPRLMSKGAELGAFELGSTVVLLGEPGRISFDGLLPGVEVRMGQRIGSVAARKKKRARKKKPGAGRKRSGGRSSTIEGGER